MAAALFLWRMTAFFFFLDSTSSAACSEAAGAPTWQLTAAGMQTSALWWVAVEPWKQEQSHFNHHVTKEKAHRPLCDILCLSCSVGGIDRAARSLKQVFLVWATVSVEKLIRLSAGDWRGGGGWEAAAAVVFLDVLEELHNKLAIWPFLFSSGHSRYCRRKPQNSRAEVRSQKHSVYIVLFHLFLF